MDQLICASLSHTHYWYEVGMFKVPAAVLDWCAKHHCVDSTCFIRTPPIFTFTARRSLGVCMLSLYDVLVVWLIIVFLLYYVSNCTGFENAAGLRTNRGDYFLVGLQYISRTISLGCTALHPPAPYGPNARVP